MLGIGDRHMVDAVRKVIDRTHAADAEEGQGQLLVTIACPAKQTNPTGDGTYDKQNDERDHDVDPDYRREQSAYQCSAEQNEQDHHREPLNLLGDGMHFVLKLMIAVRAAKRQCGHEHGKEAIDMNDFGRECQEFRVRAGG